MRHIFISYGQKDTEYVQRLQEDLVRQGFSVWMDERFDHDAPWPKIIQDHLNNCDALILIVSENSFESEWVPKEVARAKRIGKPVFPILLDGSRWPSVESSQGTAVKNQEMLPEKFYARLALLTPPEEHPVEETLTKREAAQSAPNEARKFDLRQMGWWAAALIGTVGIVISLWLNGTFQPASVPVPTNPPTVHPFVIASLTPTGAVTATPASSALTTAADQSAIILVPAGNFIMGSYNGNVDEKPVHTVYLNAFYIDKYAVTNALYRSCVDANACAFPKFENSYSRPTYYGDPRYDQYPVIGVTWAMAKAYCEWRGARLLTEAEWEKAARGTDGRIYPWGNSIDQSAANYNPNDDPNYAGDTTKVDAYPGGVSPYGVFDMAGNVWEWVADIYDANYYASLTLPVANPLGATSGSYRVLKGGSWDSGSYDLRSARRNWIDPLNANVYIGFRCARNP
ncbi:MAG TPA: SUMF1/EgtB/PvdO family nonheme iron enzyme [Anaerolineales bacterium]|nr:SUMF1/EgtB/PvdO family nonheme iron enzyme [Anaerolineales bacterium]